MELIILLLLAALPVLMVTGGLYDLTTMTIPNRISGLLILGFFPAAFAVGLSLTDVVLQVGIGLIALVIGAGMFALRWIGGGDAKLMAGACLWMGLTGSGVFILATALAGGLFCVTLIFARFWLQPWAIGAPAWIGRLMEPKGDIPYGVAIACGALMAFPYSSTMTAFSVLNG